MSATGSAFNDGTGMPRRAKTGVSPVSKRQTTSAVTEARKAATERRRRWPLQFMPQLRYFVLAGTAWRDSPPVPASAAFLASVTADVVCRLLTGDTPVFALRGMPVPSLNALPVALIVEASQASVVSCSTDP